MKRFASVPARRAAWLARWRTLPRGWRTATLAGLVALALMLLGGMAFRDALGRWLWPDPRYDALRQRAERALQAGHLSSADGGGARELFEAALALQPDQLEARDGLARVALAAIAQAEARAGAGDPAQAQAALQLARELQAPKARIDAAEAQLQALRAQSAGIDIDTLLERARAAHAAGHLDGDPDAALSLYQQVLQAQPRNQRALEGREDALEDLLRPADALLARGEVAQAAGLVRRVERFDPGYAALPALRAGLARAMEAQGVRIRRLLARGQAERAAHACGELRVADIAPLPEPCAAPLGEALLRAAARAPRTDDAARLLALAEEAGVDVERLRQARRQSQPADRSPAQPLQTPRVRARIATLLDQAESAHARGDWLTPPGDSAWDRLREARALAPHDPRVLRASESLLAAARACNADALRDNNLGRAQVCLDAWRQLAPSDDGVAQARQRLAQRWIAVGIERLEAGRAGDARRALEQARALDPRAPGLDGFAERVGKLQ